MRSKPPLPSLLPVPIFVVAGPETLPAPRPWRDTLTFFRPGVRYRGPWEDDGPPEDAADLYPSPFDDRPLTTAERAVYAAFGVMVCLTLLAFLVVVAVAHSPFNAN
jgi:hypothetical protein